MDGKCVYQELAHLGVLSLKIMATVILAGASSWIWWLALPLLALLLLPQIQYMVRQFRSVRWPVIDATIQKGPTGFVPIGSGQGTPAYFVGYTFQVNGSTFSGLFALYGWRDDVERVSKNFSGGSIRVRYDPANPAISYVNNLSDPRFDRLTPTQNPQHLQQAPSFDLQNVLRS
jgi:hypothetical protein